MSYVPMWFKKMKIIIDNKIPYIRGAFESVAEVIYLPGSATTSEIVKDADAIITRTRTICNEKLLSGSSVKFIATATIGYDHIDTDYCDATGIKWTNAPGCNSKSVEQYIASALLVMAKNKNLTLKELSIGVVGVGNVGCKVARICEIFGMKVLLNDPPRERVEGSDAFVSLEQIMEQADIITLHVPLNLKGKDSTFHLVDEAFFLKLRKKIILINSSRGEVVETNDVKNALKNSMISAFVCDCWEDEPFIDLELLTLTDLATPHIAGYSKDGKANGTKMSVDSISKFFALGLDDWQPFGLVPPTNPQVKLDGFGLSDQEIFSKTILATYDIRSDDRILKNNPLGFEHQRGDYPLRREFPAFTIQAKNVENQILVKLKELGFIF